MKKAITLFLLIAAIMTLAACTADAQPTQLGTSAFSITLPRGYAMEDDDFSEDQVAYYYKDDNSIDFDVYQWAKGEEYTLESEAEYFAAEYGTTPEAVVVNGINCMKYVSKESYDGYEYTVVNYMFEDELSIVELCFWTVDSAEEYAAIDEIIGTLTKN